MDAAAPSDGREVAPRHCEWWWWAWGTWAWRSRSPSAEAGCQVVGVDADARRVEVIRDGESYIEDVPSETLRAVAGQIEPTTRYSRLARVDAVLPCVPTPLTPQPGARPLPAGGCDASRRGLPPGRPPRRAGVHHVTGDDCERVVPLLDESSLAAGEDFHVAFSPERVDPGRVDHIWQVVDAAATKPCGFMRFEPAPGMGGDCLRVDRSTSPGGHATSRPRRRASLPRSLRRELPTLGLEGVELEEAMRTPTSW